MKIVRPTTCKCSICSRARSRQPRHHASSSTQSHNLTTVHADTTSTTPEKTEIKFELARLKQQIYDLGYDDDDDDKDTLVGPSSEPFTPALAQTIPNELLSLIFSFARPQPTASSPTWASYRLLSLVCARWTPAAQRALVEHIVIFRSRQVALLVDALREGVVDGERVVSIMFNVGTAGEEGPRKEDLREVVENCSNVEAFRLRGFGEKAWMEMSPRFFSSTSSSSLPTTTTPTTKRQLVPKLRSLEYSPLDHAAPATTESILGWLSDLPSLHSLELSSHLIPLSLHTPTHLTTLPLARLTSLSLHSVRLDITTFLLLSSSSLDSLRSLTLKESYLLLHPTTSGSFPPLLKFFKRVGPNLKSLTWENKLHPDVGGVSTSTEFWELISQCTGLRKLALFSRFAFEERPESYRLPGEVEELSLGARGGLVTVASVWGWLDLATVTNGVEKEVKAFTFLNPMRIVVTSSTTSTSTSTSTSSPPPPSSSSSGNNNNLSTIPSSSSSSTANQTSTSQRQRRGRRDRERTRSKGKRHITSSPPSGRSTPSS
ncbi:hypothetical protein P7C70_g9039, partial [Phenoliferia sp. Uapishka_3]